MVAAMREELLEPPTFEDSGHAVTVSLPIRSAVTPLERAWIGEIERRDEPGDRFLLVHAARGEHLTNSRARVMLGIDVGDARKALHSPRRRLPHATWHARRVVLHAHGHPGAACWTPALPAELAEFVMADARNPESPPLTNTRVRALTGLDRVEALALLESLVRAERLQRLGERRGTRYEPIGE